MAKVELKADGQEVPSNKSVVNFISETVAGMINPLWGVGEVKTVELKIERFGLHRPGL
jgi:hypothetical protein